MKRSTVPLWKTQSCNLTTNQKVNINLFSTKCSATKNVMWECRVDEFFESRSNIISCMYLLTALVLKFDFPKTTSREVTDTLKYGQHL